MKVTFYSNFINHHQLPFCKEMIKLGVDFTFVATEKIHEERIKLGYEDMNEKYPFILRTYESKENFDKAIELSLDSDLVIIGSASEIFIKERLKKDKIVFRYSERIFKDGRWKIRRPRTFLSLIKNHTMYNNKKLYMLCASAYTAGDFKVVNAYKNKTFKWGYFPETIEYDIDKLINRKNNNEVIEILWAGRFLDWKHPEYTIYLAEYLRDRGYKFKIKLLGNGPLENTIKEKIFKLKLESYVEMIGSVKAEKVRVYMEQANIFLFTSDQGEGWGAVANEAMNSACVVVANKKIGSVPFLIDKNVNGLVYENKKEFLENVENVLRDKLFRENVSREAYKTITKVWNSKNAAYQILRLKEILENGVGDFNIDGPCSKANSDW